ncbi:MAG: hypothetical protein L0196_01025 [candidate division Zixibacteria bacterium]|nr:hypothetical protein [candidate division Zixibacteria bacterium]
MAHFITTYSDLKEEWVRIPSPGVGEIISAWNFSVEEVLSANSVNLLFDDEMQYKESAGVYSFIESTLSDLSFYGALIPRPSEVRDYLVKNLDLVGLLPLIFRLVLREFDVSYQFSLEVYHDPEIEEEHLVFYIRQDKYQKNIIEKIRRVRAQYQKLLIGKSGWLLVTTDFQLPLKKK